MNNGLRRYYTTLGCTFLCMFLLWRLPSYNDVESSTITRQQEVSSDTVVLVPGELPGYTGWARPEETKAGYFRITSHDAAAVAGEEWTVTVECMECHGTAHFYARAHGPAVLAGIGHSTHDNNRTAYTISFLPMDAGSYTVEVVLVSSGAPSWDDFPLVGEEPWYEGFLLPDFPLQLHVAPLAAKASDVNRKCIMSNLLSETTDSAYRKARWVVVDKVSHRNHVLSTNASRQVNIRDYRSGHQSLGIFMDYQYQHCTLYSYPEASRRLENYTNVHKNLHVIFVGDSVMRLQRTLFQSTFPNMKTAWIRTSGGMVQMMHNVTAQLHALSQSSPNQRRFLFFNTGLHDISQLCSRVCYEERHVYMKESDANFSCTALYRRSLSHLVDLIQHFPAELKVFQSTTAGWLRYGNYGIEWLLNETQDLAISSHMVEYFNEIAFEVLSSSKIRMMDGYWITLARPDNRQIGLVSNRGRHLVHPGEEVLRAMVRNWIHVLLEHFASAD